MKGISPMLATILLVAFTVAVGGLISVWMTSFTRTTQSNVESASLNQTKCAGTYIDVISVATAAITVVNRGSQTITSVKCYAANGSDISRGGLGDLGSGGSNITTWTTNVTTSATGTYVAAFGTIVTCSGKCLSVGVTGQCKSGESCWTAS